MPTTCIYLSQATDQQYSADALGYVEGHKQDILDFASLLNISAGAIAGIMAEENNAYFDSEYKKGSGRMFFDHLTKNMMVGFSPIEPAEYRRQAQDECEDCLSACASSAAPCEGRETQGSR